jgi:hypothetical protein
LSHDGRDGHGPRYSLGAFGHAHDYGCFWSR